MTGERLISSDPIRKKLRITAALTAERQHVHSGVGQDRKLDILLEVLCQKLADNTRKTMSLRRYGAHCRMQCLSGKTLRNLNAFLLPKQIA
jgi:hypothetical protein